MHNDVSLLIARFVLAAIFFVAGMAKLWDMAGSRAAMVGFGQFQKLMMKR